MALVLALVLALALLLGPPTLLALLAPTLVSMDDVTVSLLAARWGGGGRC